MNIDEGGVASDNNMDTDNSGANMVSHSNDSVSDSDDGMEDGNVPLHPPYPFRPPGVGGQVPHHPMPRGRGPILPHGRPHGPGGHRFNPFHAGGDEVFGGSGHRLGGKEGGVVAGDNLRRAEKTRLAGEI